MATTAEAPRFVKLARISRLAHEIGTSGRLNGHSQGKIDCAGVFFGRALHDASLAGQKRESLNGGAHPLLELGNIFFQEALKERRNPATEAHLSGMMRQALSVYDVLADAAPSLAAHNNRGIAKEFLEDYEGAVAEFAKASSMAKDEGERRMVENNLSFALKAKERHEDWESGKETEIPQRI